MQSCETRFLRIFEDGRNLHLLGLSDAKLRTDDGCTFDIHRVTLAGNSDYFRRMFCGMDKMRRKFRIPGISGRCLSDILCYIYTDKIRLTRRNVADLIIGADYLLLENLIMKIKSKIKPYINEVNCLTILKAAAQTSNEDIFQKCFRFIQTRFEGIMRYQTDHLADLPPEILRWILRDRNLYVYNENTVWQAIVAWTQKDLPDRMSYVPKLLLTLAMEDVGDELATEILQHEIISKNSFMKDLLEIPSSNDFTINTDVLFTFLRSYSNCFMEQNQNHSHRIPSQLFVILSYSNDLYVTYDEKTDLCRKITEVSFRPDVLIAVGHNIYLFKMDENIFLNFDLNAMDWVRTERFWNDDFDEYLIVATDAYIYVLSEIEEDLDDLDDEVSRFDVKVYDMANNMWFNGVPHRNIVPVAAVRIKEKVYVVGHTRSLNGMMTQMFDPDTQQWSSLSPPTVYRSEFELVAYHQKIYLIGKSDAEVFDPTTNLWKELPKLPYTNISRKAIVFNDQIIVYNIINKVVRWNNVNEYWEEFPETDVFNDLYSHSFCTIYDVDTIRMITKQNRDPQTQMRDGLNELRNFN